MSRTVANASAARLARLRAALVWAAMIGTLWVAGIWDGHGVLAADSPAKAATSRAARAEAIRSIPLDRLAPAAKDKVAQVIHDASLFRRLPVQVVDCEPELFHFLAGNPEVIVSIWQEMGLTHVSMGRIDGTRFRCSDGDGTTAEAELVYRDHDTHIVYADGLYDGPMLPRPVRGSCVVVLKTATVRETNGRYYVTARLDTFLRVENAGLELVAKLFQGWVGRTIDHNFGETIAFVGNISSTAETNPLGMRRLAAKLQGIGEPQRQQFITMCDGVAGKLAAVRSPQVAAALPASAAPTYPPSTATAETSDRERPAWFQSPGGPAAGPGPKR